MLFLNACEAREQTLGPLPKQPQKSQMPLWLYLPADTTEAGKVWPPVQHVHFCFPNLTHCIPLLRSQRGTTQNPNVRRVWEIQTSQSRACNRECNKGVGIELREEICSIWHIIFLIFKFLFFFHSSLTSFYRCTIFLTQSTLNANLKVFLYFHY